MANMNNVVFQYKAETTVATLLRHHRIARWIIYPCGFFSLFMFSSLAQGMLTGFDPITIALSIVSVCALAILVIPALLCLPWIRDIEVELAKRGTAVPGGQDIDKRIVRTTGKVVLWVIVIVAAPPLIRRVLHLIAR
jgi:hypothetical protein